MLVLTRWTDEAIIIGGNIVVRVVKVQGGKVKLGVEAPELVLTRWTDEAIIIGGNIVVRVVKVQGGKVKLGVEAPEGVRIDREEIHELRTAERHASGADTAQNQPPAGSGYEQPEPGNGS